MAGEAVQTAGHGSTATTLAPTTRFPVSLGLMLVAETCILLSRSIFDSRGHEAPALDTLAWLWPVIWVGVIALCMTLASWGRLISHPSRGVVGGGRIATVMVFRLIISAGLLAAPLVATFYAIVMLILAVASANAASA